MQTVGNPEPMLRRFFGRENDDHDDRDADATVMMIATLMVAAAQPVR